VRLPASERLRAVVYPGEHYAAANGDPLQVPILAADGGLVLEHLFAGEQEHVLEITDAGADHRIVLRALLYSVADDLLGCWPLKGDLHLHSNCSDGRESPAFVAASCRRIGLDSMALTDHGQYAPSLEARDAFADVAHDLLICPGEEVHPPGNPVHMVNFGGQRSVNELFRQDAAGYERAVDAYAARYPDLKDEVTRRQVASCAWVFDQIRAADGLGIFCHPYWHVRHGYTPAGSVTAALFAHQPFDAYEVIGGYALDAVDSNTLQVARYHEERARGRTLPVVGVSDAHGCHAADLFGWYYTLVFAEQLTQASIVAAIRAGRSVAVEALPNQGHRAYGPLRLVQYALFLMSELMPGHNELCQEEGRLMLEHAGGDLQAGPALAALAGRGARYWQAAGLAPGTGAE
jgi:predicted metal-dependent phosphoesterase TrpH